MSTCPSKLGIHPPSTQHHVDIAIQDTHSTLPPTRLSFPFPSLKIGRMRSDNDQPIKTSQDVSLVTDSRFPEISLYNNIIDRCGDEDFLRDRYKTLSGWARTCTALRQRSIENLYRRVRFRKPEQLDLFVRTLKDNPELGTLVRDLHVTPANAHKHGSFDFAHPIVVKHCTNVRNLQIRQFDWGVQPDAYCQTAIASLKTITSLEVANTVFPSSRDLVQLVEALPALRELSCGLIRFEMREDSTPLYTSEPEGDAEACTHLRSVILWSLDNFPPMLTSLRGRAVTHLQLHQPDDSWPWEDVCLSIAGYQQLECLSLALVVGLGGRDGKLLTDPNSGHVFVEARNRFLDVLLHIRSAVMTTITLRLAPFLVPLADGSWQFTYRSTRMEAIRLMFGSATQELLTTWPLETLKVLYIHIQESPSDIHIQEYPSTDDTVAGWWRQTISDQLGHVPCAITVYVDQYSETRLRGNYRYDKVWLEEDSESS
ncbi:hypothetical protein GSI_05279 [Ganoderma sinense ZZ0214-1]|uniref:Uncharacterized protein n=1 Tax=Ganoderma sinense ZZ0214-1 TaxID=1077348 RepID=A0A2G8SFN6_9APHY|nr:hypothetical protein GSI_05279 [Ganoderma sinense ZZ0214-1]